MKKITFFIAFLLITLTTYSQNYIIISNTADFPATYTTAQEAHDNAEAGDILLFHGSTTSYGDLWITKPLTIQGPGYHIGQNENNYTNLSTAKINSVHFEDGSEGSNITGMSGGSIFVNTSDITIIKNNPGAILVNDNCTDCSTNPLNNVIVQGNYIGTLYSYFELNPNATNVIFTNNYVYNTSNSSAYGAIRCNGNESLIITQNVIGGAIRASNSYITNNVIVLYSNYAHTAPVYNNIYRNNIASTDFLTDNGNQANVDMSTVFVGYPTQGDYSLDARFQLIDDGSNPAKGGGLNGEDCGMFGGSDSYTLSGSPNIPTVYDIIMPVKTTPNGTLPVEVKVRTNN